MRAVYWLLRDVTLPSLRRHPLRALLTLLGVVIGVQLFATVRLINGATLRSFQHTIETIAGAADLQVANGDVGVPETLVDRIATVPGVASASGLVRGSVRTGQGGLTVFGVDLFADQHLREIQFPRRHVHIPDELRFANAVDSIALSTSYAATAGLALGDAFDVVGPTGSSRLVVRGMLDPLGPTSLFGGAVGLVDLPTAERLFARAGRVDEIDVGLAPSADRRAAEERIAGLAAGLGTVSDPRARVAGVAGMLSGLRTILAITSVLGLTVGCLLVHHAIRSATLQRRRTYAIARALGYRRGTVAAAILVEAASFGILGGAIGVLLAAVAARLSIGAVTDAVGAIWARTDHGIVALGREDVLVGLATGVASAVVGALGPAATAARLDVVAQLRATSERRRAAIGGVATVCGALLCLAGFGLFWSVERSPVLVVQLIAITAGTMIVTFGYAVLAPLLVRALTVALRIFVPRRALGLALAVEQLARDPARCRGTVGALMAAFAFVLVVSAFVTSLGGTILGWIDQAVAGDLYVGATPDLPLPTAPPLPGDVEDALRGIPGVERLAPLRLVLAPLDGWTMAIRAQPTSQFRARPFPVVESTGADYIDAFERGDAVLLSENLAVRFGLHAGDAVALDTPSGRVTLRVAAVVVDYTMDIGTLMLDLQAYRRYWRDPLVTSVVLYFAPGTDPAAVRAAVFARLAGRFPVTVLTGAEFKHNVAAAIDAAFVLTYAIELVAAVMAGIGVLNFFLAEIVDRRREIGLLRTVALDGAQLLRSLTLEAALIGACGGLLAIAWGWPIARIIVTHSARLVSGLRLDFAFPWRMAALLPVVVAATAGIAAWMPARATARMPLRRLVAVE